MVERPVLPALPGGYRGQHVHRPALDGPGPGIRARSSDLRHPGYNVAHWNIAHRDVRQSEDGSWTVDGQPLVFFHFSGIDPVDPKQFSKHQNRFDMDTLGPAAALCLSIVNA